MIEGGGGRVDEGPFDRLNDRDFDRVRLLSTRASYFTSQLMKFDYAEWIVIKFGPWIAIDKSHSFFK